MGRNMGEAGRDALSIGEIAMNYGAASNLVAVLVLGAIGLGVVGFWEPAAGKDVLIAIAGVLGGYIGGYAHGRYKGED